MSSNRMPGRQAASAADQVSRPEVIEEQGAAPAICASAWAKLRRWREEFAAAPPIFVFQMGKVGSCSVVETLSPEWPGRIVHAHALTLMSPSDRACLEFRKRFHLPILVITPIRDPLSRNVSAFFQNFERDVGAPFGARRWSLRELRRLFLERHPHHTCLEWFDRQFRPVVGIDVYATEFPRERGWRVYRHNSIRALVYRTDLDRGEQLEIISAFLSIKLDCWRIANEAAAKAYAATYREFCARVTLPGIYRRLLSSSSFAAHFWTRELIQQFNRAWNEAKKSQPRNSASGGSAPDKTFALSA